MTCLEAARRIPQALNAPSVYRLADAFQCVLAEVSKFEGVADQAAGRGGDHNLIRRCEALQSSRKIRCAADGKLRLIALARLLAHHHGPGGNADAYRQRFVERHALHRLHDFQRRTNGTLSVIFVRLGPTEVSENSVTHIARNPPFVTRNHLPAAHAVFVQQRSQLLRIQALGQRRRADQIAKHDRQLAAFAAGRCRSRGKGLGLGLIDR